MPAARVVKNQSQDTGQRTDIEAQTAKLAAFKDDTPLGTTEQARRPNHGGCLDTRRTTDAHDKSFYGIILLHDMRSVKRGISNAYYD